MAPKYKFTLRTGDRVLPSGYQRVEYLESSGTQYIDIGLEPNADEILKIEFAYVQRQSTSVIGCRASSSTKYEIGNTSGGTIYAAIGSSSYVTLTAYDTQKHTVLMNTGNGYAYIDGGAGIYIGEFVSVGKNIYAFGENNNGSIAWRSKVRIYLIEIGVRSKLIPCRRLSDGVLGMYDVVRDNFLVNSGTGTFSAGNNIGTMTQVKPVWKDDLTLEWKIETQQRFYRSDLSGTVDFIGEDYEFIVGNQFGTVFTFSIIKVANGSETEYWEGSFTHTDCKIDIDNKKVTVKPKAIDDYTDILAGQEREFNLIKLAPKIDRIRLTKRPALQIFDATSETVTTVCGNLSFETDVELPLENQQKFIREHCHFQILKDEIEVDVTDTPMGYEAGFATPFIGTIENGSGTLTNSVGTYFILYEQHVVQTVGEDIYFNSLNVYSYAQPSDLKWKYEQHSEEGYQPFPSYIEFVSQYPTIGNLKANCIDHSLYSRVICNVNVVNGVRTFAIPTDDIVTYNRNYKKCYPYDATDMIVTSQYKTQTPTEWGVDDDGWYFLPPDSGNQYIPIGRNLWDEVSVWLKVDNEYETLESSATATYMLNDAYPLWSCISVLLNEIAPEIKFQGTEDFSVFLYSGNEPLQGRDNGLWLTPKTNITNGEYKTPAQKAPVTLKQIFDMLRDVYKCYWFVETKQVGGVVTKCLRIEHVQYFLNGGSYDGTPTVGIDLTAMQNIRNGHYWSFGTNNYEYEKSEMPERYQFGWMDEVTEIFNGLPIIIVSDFVEKGRIEEINVANFTSDLDFMLLNPSGISQDGFALINALYDSVDDIYYVPVVTMQVGINTYRAQNGFLSYHMLQWAYWRYDMPARTLNIEGEVNSASRALSVSRNKKQTVSVPYGAADPDLYKLIKTGLGNGQIYQATIRLTSRMVKMQLRYETEN